MPRLSRPPPTGFQSVKQKPSRCVVLAEIFINFCAVYEGLRPTRAKIEVQGDAGEKLFAILSRVGSEAQWGPLPRLRNRLANYCVTEQQELLCDMAVPMTTEEMFALALKLKGLESFDDITPERIAEAEKQAAEELLRATDLVAKAAAEKKNAQDEKSQSAETTSSPTAEPVTTTEATAAPEGEAAPEEEEISEEQAELNKAKAILEAAQAHSKLDGLVSYSQNNMRTWYQIRRFKIPIIELMHIENSTRNKIAEAYAQKIESQEQTADAATGEDTAKPTLENEKTVLSWSVPLPNLIGPEGAKGTLVDEAVYLESPVEGHYFYNRSEPPVLKLFQPWTWVPYIKDALAESNYAVPDNRLEELFEEKCALIFRATCGSALWELDPRHVKRAERIYLNRKLEHDPPQVEVSKLDAFPSRVQPKGISLIKRDTFRDIEIKTHGVLVGGIERDATEESTLADMVK